MSTDVAVDSPTERVRDPVHEPSPAVPEWLFEWLLGPSLETIPAPLASAGSTVTDTSPVGCQRARTRSRRARTRQFGRGHRPGRLVETRSELGYHTLVYRSYLQQQHFQGLQCVLPVSFVTVCCHNLLASQAFGPVPTNSVAPLWMACIPSSLHPGSAGANPPTDPSYGGCVTQIVSANTLQHVQLLVSQPRSGENRRRAWLPSSASSISLAACLRVVRFDSRSVHSFRRQLPRPIAGAVVCPVRTVDRVSSRWLIEPAVGHRSGCLLATSLCTR